MPKIIIIYDSQTGNTAKMAEFIGRGVEKEKISCRIKKIEETKLEDLKEHQGVIIGSPTYYGQPSSAIKKLLDESVKLHGQLEGKIAAAFSSSANIGGGNETTILGLLQAFLIHGMIIQGTSSGDHYGPVSINQPDKRAEAECLDLGRRVAKLVKKLSKNN